MHIEVPLSELIPDLGQAGVREQAAGLRRKIIEESRRSEQLRMEAEKIQQEGRRAAQLQKQRAQQFDTWLNAIARVKVGDEIPIAHKPGRGKVLQVDFPGLKVKILAGGEAIDLSLQDLFPQAGPFAHHEPHRRGRPNPHAHRDGHREHAEEEPNRPIQHRDANSRAAKNSRQAILAAKPGSSVFVVPFNTRAMLVRVLPEKDHAVVQRGAFEMEVPLADLELINSDAKPSSPHKGK
jgi:dsDNA-specific endonuclease/ATPase MutS2